MSHLSGGKPPAKVVRQAPLPKPHLCGIVSHRQGSLLFSPSCLSAGAWSC